MRKSPIALSAVFFTLHAFAQTTLVNTTTTTTLKAPVTTKTFNCPSNVSLKITQGDFTEYNSSFSMGGGTVNGVMKCYAQQKMAFTFASTASAFTKCSAETVQGSTALMSCYKKSGSKAPISCSPMNYTTSVPTKMAAFPSGSVFKVTSQTTTLTGTTTSGYTATVSSVAKIDCNWAANFTYEIAKPANYACKVNTGGTSFTCTELTQVLSPK